jgi:hypothetical protein
VAKFTTVCVESTERVQEKKNWSKCFGAVEERAKVNWVVFGIIPFHDHVSNDDHHAFIK